MKILRTVIVMLLLSATATAARSETVPFDWDNLLAASIKFQKDYNYEAIADSYLQVFEPTVWNHVREDEFKLQKERKRVIAQAEEEVDRFSLDKCVRLNTWLNLGTYNFESESFPVLSLIHI